jgi:hypothetical protein
MGEAASLECLLFSCAMLAQPFQFISKLVVATSLQDHGARIGKTRPYRVESVRV